MINGAVRCFTDLPECFQTPENAIFFLQRAPKDADVNIDFQYNTVPKNCRTDAFLMAAATFGCRVLKDTYPEDTRFYREIATSAISASRLSIKDVSPAFRDEEMLERIIKRYPGEIHSLMGRIDWLVEAMSDDQLDRCCQYDFMVALDAPSHRIKGDIGRYLHLDKLDGHGIVYVRRQGRLDLIASCLKDKPWPFPPSAAQMMPTFPRSRDHLLTLLDKSDPDTPYETVYMACMMNEPIEQVVPLMVNNRLKKLLLEMHSQEALAPYLKADVGLRGLMLEEAIGL
jgi:hypothetical protein